MDCGPVFVIDGGVVRVEYGAVIMVANEIARVAIENCEDVDAVIRREVESLAWIPWDPSVNEYVIAYIPQYVWDEFINTVRDLATMNVRETQDGRLQRERA